MRKVIIEIEISAEGLDGRSCADCKGPTYKVYISERELESLNVKPLHAAAHEMGHVLAHAFGLPHNSIWTKGSNLQVSYLCDKETRMSVENEAWDVAEMMAVKRMALRSHESAFDSPTIFTYDHPLRPSSSTKV